MSNQSLPASRVSFKLVLMLDAFYLLTFLGWIPLAVMAYSLRKPVRASRFLAVVSAFSMLACLYVYYMDFIWSHTVANPIRLDLIILVPLFSALFTFLAILGVTLWRRGGSAWLTGASIVLLLMSAPTLGYMFVSFWKTQKLAAELDLVPALLLEAQFKNKENFEKTFGSIDSKQHPLAGYYQAEARAWATRLIINTDGHVWLYFHCRETTECVHSEAELGKDVREFPATIEFASETGSEFEGQVKVLASDRFSLEMQTELNGESRPYMNPVVFHRADIPYTQPQPLPEAVRFLGVFSQTKVEQARVELVQVWLWQAGNEFLGYHVRLSSLCGVERRFVSAVPTEGSQQSQAVVLKSAKSSDSLVLQNVSEDQIQGELHFNGQRLSSLDLRRQTVIHSDRYEVAPLTSLQDTKKWLEAVSLGYMMEWNASCPTP